MSECWYLRNNDYKFEEYFHIEDDSKIGGNVDDVDYEK